MARDIPSPCCGSFSVAVKENIGNDKVLYSCHCGNCGIQYGNSADSRAEALYNYDEKCLSSWRHNPNGLQDWMKEKTKSKEDVIRRQAVIEHLKKYFER